MTKSEKHKMPLFVDFQAVAANKNPYGVILETPKGFSKEENSTQIISPMGFSSRARIDITNVI